MDLHSSTWRRLYDNDFVVLPTSFDGYYRVSGRSWFGGFPIDTTLIPYDCDESEGNVCLCCALRLWVVFAITMITSILDLLASSL